MKQYTSYLKSSKYIISTKKAGYEGYKYTFDHKSWVQGIDIELCKKGKCFRNNKIIVYVCDKYSNPIRQPIKVIINGIKNKNIESTKMSDNSRTYEFNELIPDSYTITATLKKSQRQSTRKVRLQNNSTHYLIMIF